MHRSPLLRLSFLWLVLLGAPATVTGAGADTFYVAPSGSDANPGTQASPWATLQHAADTVTAGDTVLVRAGQYVGMHLTTSGTATDPIVFAAFPGEVPEIVADNTTTPDGLNLEGTDWIVVEGFRVDGRTRAGIRAVLCEHVVIRGNRLDANGRWGIFTGFCDDLLIEDNVATDSIIEHGIYVSNSGDRPWVRRNLLVGNNANGLHMNGDLSAGGDGVISDALVEENVIVDNGVGGGSGINCDGVQSSTIRNNLIVDSHASGISLYRIDGGAPSIGNRVLHNTVVVADDGRWALNIQNGSTDNVVHNNILYSEHSFRGAISISADSLSGFVSDGNALEDRFTLDDGNTTLTLAQWRQQTGQDGGSLASEPSALFVDAAGGDHHLGVDSPALDLGVALPDAPRDLEGRPRPLGPSPDAGCYEGAAILFLDDFESGDVGLWSSAVP